MPTYSYRSIMGTLTDTVEGIHFQAGVNISFDSDQPGLNKHVPSRLDRYIDGVLSNDRSTFSDSAELLQAEALSKQNGLVMVDKSSGKLRAFGEDVSATRVSPKCVFCIPTLQQVGSGTARDISGNGHDFALGSAIVDNGSGVWSDTSREFNALAKIPDSLSGANYLYMPSLPVVWDLSEWFIFSTILQPTVAPQARNLISCAFAGTSAGWYLKADANGKLYVVIINGALGVGGNIASTPVLLTSGKRSVINVTVDSVNKNIYLYVNGVLTDQWLNSWSGSGASSRFLSTTTNAITAGDVSVPTYGMLLGGMHYYKGTGALPSNHAAIAHRLAMQPFTPLNALELP